MHERKKVQGKETFKAIKKTTLQQINYTEELHIPTSATMELRQGGRSIDLKKNSGKKPVSRKSRCISVKQTNCQNTMNLKQLLKQFNSMKLIQERSRSPQSSSKSKRKGKRSNKLITQMPLLSKENSEGFLSVKIERNLEKLRNSKYFRDEEESDIPLISTEDAFSQEEMNRILSTGTENFEDINIQEMRLFCKQSEPNMRISIEYFTGNVYEMMARKIQRAWRRYQTEKLVQRYANLVLNPYEEYVGNGLIPSRSEELNILSEELYTNEELHRKETYISNLEDEAGESASSQSDQARKESTFRENAQRENNQQDQRESEVLKQIRREEPEKWAQIVALIQQNKQLSQENENNHEESDNEEEEYEESEESEDLKAKDSKSSDHSEDSDELKHENHLRSGEQSTEEQQELFKEKNIEEENGKKEEIYDLNPSFRRREEFSKEENIKIEEFKEKERQKRSNKGSNFSEDSSKINDEEFNSRKYIEYLDSDMYPMESGNGQNVMTITKKKQEQLLNKLQDENSLKRLIKGNKISIDGNELDFENQVKSRLSYRSKSELSHDSSIQAEELKVSRKTPSSPSAKLLEMQIRRSSSEKNIKYSKSRNENSRTIEREDDENDENVETFPLIPQNEQKNLRGEIRSLLLDVGSKETQSSDNKREQRLKSDNSDPESQFRIPEEQLERFDKEKNYLEDELARKMAELQKLREDDSESSDENENENEENYNEKIDTNVLDEEIRPVLHRSISDIRRNSDEEEEIESDEESDTAEKGEEVTEMLTNSLILEVLVELAKSPETLLKSFKKLSLKKPKAKRSGPKPKKSGFNTTQSEIKSFIEELCNYVMNEEPHIFKNLEKATGPSALEMLKYMHQSVEEDIYMDESEDDPSVMILPNWIFENFWSRKSSSLQYEKQGLEEEREQQRQEYLKGLNKIFLRSCFDCFNECLDYERNYGPFGKPFPWKKSHQFEHRKSFEETRKSVLNSQNKLFEISSSYCGIIIEKEEIASLCGNEEYIAQVQEDRLSRMLAKDLVEGEERWIFYDDEETELLVETSNVIFYNLLEEVVMLL